MDDTTGKGPAMGDEDFAVRELSPRAREVLTVAWPSFLMAGVMEMLVFAVVDPKQLHWFGREEITWSAPAVYTVSFFIFWLVIALAGGITRMLNTEFDSR